MADKHPQYTEEDLPKLPEQAQVEIAKKVYGAQDDVEARFMLGIMDGSIKGDVLEVEDDADR